MLFNEHWEQIGHKMTIACGFSFGWVTYTIPNLLATRDENKLLPPLDVSFIVINIDN